MISAEKSMGGSKIKVKYSEDDYDVIKIVGPSEVDPLNNEISYLSPLGSAIFNSKVGNIHTILLEDSSYTVEIIEIL